MDKFLLGFYFLASFWVLNLEIKENLNRSCEQVEPGHTILYHAAAGGVGSLVCQWASALGATIIGTVSTKEKVAQAKEDGCHHVIVYKEESFVGRVMEITSGKGVDVVYESIGKDTFQVLCLHAFLIVLYSVIVCDRISEYMFFFLFAGFTWVPKGSTVRGYLITYGMASGEYEPLRFQEVAKKGIYCTTRTQ